jgi:hypothetical protein
MTNVWFMAGLILISTAAIADNFVYNINGKRDPFQPLVSPSGAVITYDGDMTVTDMILEGIVADPQGNNLAIINGKIMKASDVVGGYTVQQITTDSVELIKGEEHFTLKLKKGDI